jgi:hypothetical protein
VLTHLHGSRHYIPVGLKDIISNFSWETLISLPPSELLSLVVLLSAVFYLLSNLVLRLVKNT